MQYTNRYRSRPPITDCRQIVCRSYPAKNNKRPSLTKQSKAPHREAPLRNASRHNATSLTAFAPSFGMINVQELRRLAGAEMATA